MTEETTNIVNPAAIARSTWDAMPLHQLPVGDFRSVGEKLADAWTRIENAASDDLPDAHAALNTALEYMLGIQRFDGLLSRCSPEALLAPLAERANDDVVELCIGELSDRMTPSQCRSRLAQFRRGMRFYCADAETGALEAAIRALPVAEEKRHGETHVRLRALSKPDLEKQYPVLSDLIKAASPGLAEPVLKRSPKLEQGFWFTTFGRYVLALKQRRPMIARSDGKALLVEAGVDAFIDDLTAQGADDVAEQVERLGQGWERICDDVPADFIYEKAEELRARDHTSGEQSKDEEGSKSLLRQQDLDLFNRCLDKLTLSARRAGLNAVSAGFRKKIFEDYRGYLRCVAAFAPELLDRPVDERFSPQTVEKVINIQRLTVMDGVIAQRLTHIRNLLDRNNLLKPAADRVDYRWLSDRSHLLRRFSKQVSETKAYVPVLDILEQAFAQMNEAIERWDILDRTVEFCRRGPIAKTFRDALMIAFVALNPLRGRSLEEPRLGTTIVRGPLRYRVTTKGKNGLLDVKDMPAILTPYLDIYVDIMRVHIAEDVAAEDFWVSSKGGALTQSGMAKVIASITQETFDIKISTHGFRYIVATDASRFIEIDPSLASKLLHHVTPLETETTYILSARTIARQMLVATIGGFIAAARKAA